MHQVAFLLGVLLGIPDAASPFGQGVRVVDGVNVTVVREETAHALSGEEMTVGETAGRRWRSAAAWFSYTLRIYEDTPLTVVCAFAATVDHREAFDVLVDGRKAATEVREPLGRYPGEFRFSLPLTDTVGKTEVTVTFRAHAGSQTARLFEVRSVQEHLE
jgi:hypothetical protein